MYEIAGDDRQMTEAQAPKTDDDWRHLRWDALDRFSPGAPIDDLNLLAGRIPQIHQMLDTVMQRGQHAILYGERGVGKSSLANTFSVKLVRPTRSITCTSVNCDPSDNFTRLWRKVFRRLSSNEDNLSDKYLGDIYPDDVVYELSKFQLTTSPIVILDEFDKIPDINTRELTANTIKYLSNHSLRVTVILVGVADSVEDLIADHASISRCLRQIHMQRMVPAELIDIVQKRFDQLGMTTDQATLAHMVTLSRGLPHYAHLVGQQSAACAIDRHELAVGIEHVDSALSACIEQTDQSIRSQHHQATISSRRTNIYKEVLLAAALAQVDELGYFQPVSLQVPIAQLLDRDAKVPLFGQHLKKLCLPERGAILEQTGSQRRYRYRFVEPMMQSFILMNGLQNGSISREQVSELAETSYQPRLSTEF